MSGQDQRPPLAEGPLRIAAHAARNVGARGGFHDGGLVLRLGFGTSLAFVTLASCSEDPADTGSGAKGGTGGATTGGSGGAPGGGTGGSSGGVGGSSGAMGVSAGSGGVAGVDASSGGAAGSAGADAANDTPNDAPVPPAPTGLYALPSTGKVTLTWDATPGATGFVVHRATTAGAQPSAANAIGTASGTTYADATVTNHVLYYYVVTATAGGAESPPSNERMGRVPLWQKIAAGWSFSAGLRTDGALYTMGRNNYGSLGDGKSGNGNDQAVAERIQAPAGAPAGATFKQLAVGHWHSIAVLSDESVWTWGDNTYGQMADGTSGALAFHATMTKIAFGASYASATWKVGAGGNSSAALSNGSALLVMGYNLYGGLGVNSQSNVTSPAAVPPPSAASVWSSMAMGNLHSVFLANNGGVYAAGANGSGQLGTGTIAGSNSAVPVCQTFAGTCTLAFSIAAAGGVTPMVAAGYDFSVALRGDGTLWAWGTNFYGNLGQGNTGGNSLTPKQVALPLGSPAGAKWVAVSAGRDHVLALRSDGTLWAWGRNSSGQLGDGTQTDRNLPVQVCAKYDWQTSTCTAFLALGASAGASSFSAGWFHGFAQDSTGVWWAWGENPNGGLGVGASANTCYPGGAATPCSMVPELVP